MSNPSFTLGSSARLLLILCIAILLACPDGVDAAFHRRAKNRGNRGGNRGGNKGNNGGSTGKVTTPPAATVPTTTSAAPASTATIPPPFAQDSFCAGTGLTASDGTQIKTGACSSTPMGAIPAVTRMVSSLITAPAFGARVNAAKDLQVTADYRGLTTGFFSDATLAYYSIPQTLAADGTIQGHAHITVQALGTAVSAPDPQAFAFFKGLNQVATGGRTLSVTVPAGSFTTNGVYRICSLSGANSHQPVVMPVAQRGAQDDCIRITVFNAGAVKSANGQ
ncbi:hypothetical protein HKX48_007828 [Thoreauomyces humboldtii]|nr:hypothetical protein HKX48_007828 [Thoreauomyces humboldtii]